MPETLAMKLRVWWHRDELDEQLVHGADPMSGAQLACRAAQLQRRSTRVSFAGALEDAVREAYKPWSMSARLPLARVAIRGCTEDLITLAQRLRADDPIDVRGAASVARLVCNGTSPLYGDAQVTLLHAVRAARLALDPPAVVRVRLSEVA